MPRKIPVTLELSIENLSAERVQYTASIRISTLLVVKDTNQICVFFNSFLASDEHVSY